MGAYGLRPVVEIQFADYIYPAYDQIVSEAAKMRYRSGGQFTAPIVVRSPYGGGIFGGQTHSQSPESLFTHIAGLKVVIPSNPYDAKGLLTAAIEDDDPVVFFEPKRLYNGPFDGWHEKPVSAVEGPGPGPGSDRQICRAHRQGARDARRKRRHHPGLWHHGLGRPGRRGTRGRGRRGHRPALARAAGHRSHRGLA
jgi:hypothetical protein